MFSIVEARIGTCRSAYSNERLWTGFTDKATDDSTDLWSPDSSNFKQYYIRPWKMLVRTNKTVGISQSACHSLKRKKNLLVIY